MTSRERQRAAKAYARMCKYIGIDLKGDAVDTPMRVVKALEEMTANGSLARRGLLPFKFSMFKSRGDCIIVSTNNVFTSLCEHHHMPFYGSTTIGYRPNKSVAGLSKFPRLVDFYAATATTQEELTCRVADKIEEILQPFGVVVVVQAVHTCVCSRGARKTGNSTVTCAVRGKDGIEIKNEVMKHMELDRGRTGNP